MLAKATENIPRSGGKKGIPISKEFVDADIEFHECDISQDEGDTIRLSMERCTKYIIYIDIKPERKRRWT